MQRIVIGVALESKHDCCLLSEIRLEDESYVEIFNSNLIDNCERRNKKKKKITNRSDEIEDSIFDEIDLCVFKFQLSKKMTMIMITAMG